MYTKTPDGCKFFFLILRTLMHNLSTPLVFIAIIALVFLIYYRPLYETFSQPTSRPDGESGTFVSNCDTYSQNDGGVTHHCVMADGSIAIVKPNNDMHVLEEDLDLDLSSDDLDLDLSSDDLDLDLSSDDLDSEFEPYISDPEDEDDLEISGV